jgi:cytochrome P450
VTSHELVRALLTDPRVSVRGDRPRRPPGDDAPPVVAGEDAPEPWFLRCTSQEMLRQDPPDHARIRRLHTAFFTVRRVNEHRAQIEQTVAHQQAVMKRSGPPVDLYAEFALPVVSMTICDMLDVPRTERARFERQVMPDNPYDPAQVSDSLAALSDVVDYAHEVVERKRADPGSDVLSSVIASGELTDEELVGAAQILFTAGHHTTATMLALGTFALLEDRQRWDLLVAQPSLIPAAVEELLRYLSIFQNGGTGRTAREDIAVDGEVIKAGESIMFSFPAANRDLDRFSEPDMLDLERDASAHVAFGHGRHMCLGQHLARLELQVGLAGLVRGFPTLRLAVAASDVPRHSAVHPLYGVHTLPVAW